MHITQENRFKKFYILIFFIIKNSIKNAISILKYNNNNIVIHFIH